MPLNRTAAMRKVFIIGRQLGFDKDGIRDIAASLLSIPSDEISLAKLTDRQLCQLLDHLSGQAPATGPVPVKNGASHRQLYLIRQLATGLGWDSDPKRLAGFIGRQTAGKKTALADLTIFEASRIIEGLKNVVTRPPAAQPAAQPLSELPIRSAYPVRDLVKHLGISKQTIYRLIESGKLEALRVGKCIRIPRTALLTYLESNRPTPVQ